MGPRAPRQRARGVRVREGRGAADAAAALREDREHHVDDRLQGRSRRHALHRIEGRDHRDDARDGARTRAGQHLRELHCAGPDPDRERDGEPRTPCGRSRRTRVARVGPRANPARFGRRRRLLGVARQRFYHRTDAARRRRRRTTLMQRLWGTARPRARKLALVHRSYPLMSSRACRGTATMITIAAVPRQARDDKSK